MQKQTKNLNSVIMEIAMQKGKKDKKFMDFKKKDKGNRKDKVKEMVKEQLTNPSKMLKEEFSYLDKALNESLMDSIQSGASWLAAGLSFIPGLNVVGSGLEAANALTYALRGQYGNAAMSGAMAGLGLIPGVGGVGRIATAGAKAVARPVAGAVARTARGASTAIDDVTRAADAVADARKVAREISLTRAPRGVIHGEGRFMEPGLGPSAELVAKGADAIAKAKAARDVIQTQVPILGKVPTVRGAIGQIQGKIARGAESIVPGLAAHERALVKSQYKLGPKRAAAAGAAGSSLLGRSGLGTLGTIGALHALGGAFGTSPGAGVVDPSGGGNLKQLSSEINVSLMPQMRQIALSAPTY